jgi:putative ABC transport system substrate-binding protein
MRRRDFLAALLSAPALELRVAAAQQNEPPRRIGILLGWSDSDPAFRDLVAGLVDDLAGLGWKDGPDTSIEIRWAKGDMNRASLLAEELAASRPSVLFSATTPVTAALQRATKTVPIVFAIVADPVGAGFVASFAHPGGNITGFTNIEVSSHGKLVDLVRQIAPGIKRAGIIFNPDTAPSGGRFYLPAFEASARSLGDPMVLPVHNDAEIESAITALGREQGGLVVMSDAFFSGPHMETVISSARRNNVPSIFEAAFFPARGGLISYGSDVADVFRHASEYVDRILRGESPADLPVQAPTKFNLTINLKTAKALGLNVPATLLASANEVIE